MRNTTSLEAFDILELLSMLAGQGKTGLMQVDQTGPPFMLWLTGGRVQSVTFGPLRGAGALGRMLSAPHGQFVFDPDLRHPDPDLDVTLDALTWEALDSVPLPSPDFSGPGRLGATERVAALPCTPEEREVLRRIEAQEPVGEVGQQDAAARVVGKLWRMGLLTERRPRVARLTLGVLPSAPARPGARLLAGLLGDRAARPPGDAAAVVDETILAHWRASTGLDVPEIAVRLDDGRTLILSVRGAPGITNALLLPPDLLVQLGLRAGLSVLTRPA